jgi:hypothetical protein
VVILKGNQPVGVAHANADWILRVVVWLCFGRIARHIVSPLHPTNSFGGSFGGSSGGFLCTGTAGVDMLDTVMRYGRFGVKK